MVVSVPADASVVLPSLSDFLGDQELSGESAGMSPVGAVPIEPCQKENGSVVSLSPVGAMSGSSSSTTGVGGFSGGHGMAYRIACVLQDAQWEWYCQEYAVAIPDSPVSELLHVPRGACTRDA